eukprot:CAMPEP_0174369882 /NCGR_PEP_ID=MMETSP0811_2-20130205/94142_1 /TAXON_ID=73025 ORGANISM="Eutreptiella gymnastica-like, Strain CCMP1594" /NCGR_SAMPLE_ID=MMETSP0811_2 /ASSEMBLY_ACC=CAM_ASM_000667 /LENGTH=49 /DNA_ID= /DNA_START= /DNA_END= /DNA_ORIENTATION=
MSKHSITVLPDWGLVDAVYLTNWDAGNAILTITGLWYPWLVTGALMMPL